MIGYIIILTREYIVSKEKMRFLNPLKSNSIENLKTEFQVFDLQGFYKLGIISNGLHFISKVIFSY